MIWFCSCSPTLRSSSVPKKIIMLGQPPNRIDLLRAISGVEFQQAWDERVIDELDGIPTTFISKKLLIANKLATGRERDSLDARMLSITGNE